MSPVESLTANLTSGIVFLAFVHILDVLPKCFLVHFFATYLAEGLPAGIVFVYEFVVTSNVFVRGAITTDFTSVLHAYVNLGLVGFSREVGREILVTMPAFYALALGLPFLAHF